MEKKITFSAQDNGVASMMDRLRSQSSELARGLMQDAARYSNSGKDQIKYLQEQIKLIEQRNRLDSAGAKLEATSTYQERLAGAYTPKQKEAAAQAYKAELATITSSAQADEMQVKLMRELIDTVRTTAQQEILEDRKNVERQIQEVDKQVLRGGIDSVEGDTLLKTAIQRDSFPEEKQKQEEGNLLRSILQAGIVRQLGGLVNQLPTARSEYELVTPSIQLAGGATGAALGTAADALTLGQTEFQLIGTELGNQVGQFFGSALSRTLQTQQQYQDAVGLMSGLTGGKRSTAGLNMFGMDAIQSAQLQGDLTQARGAAIDNNQIFNAVAIQKAYGLDQGTIRDRFSLGALSGGDNITGSLNNLITVLQRQGVDRAYLGQVVQNQSQLTRMFAQNANEVRQGDVNRAMVELGKAGGQFGLNDVRSFERLQQVNQALANPANDFQRAQNFGVLRRLNPEASIDELMDMEQKGLQTPGFLKGVLGETKDSGMGRSFQILSLMKRLGVNRDAAISLLDADMTVSDSELQGMTDMSSIAAFGSSNVSQQSKSAAAISDAFLEGPIKGLEEVSIRFLSLMKELTAGLGEYIKEQANFTDLAKKNAEELEKREKVRKITGSANPYHAGKI